MNQLPIRETPHPFDETCAVAPQMQDSLVQSNLKGWLIEDPLRQAAKLRRTPGRGKVNDDV
jgi:hypothetical protein